MFRFDPTAPGATLDACEDAVACAFPRVPEIGCGALAARLAAGLPTSILDVRGEAEHAVSRIPGARHVPPETPAWRLLGPYAPPAGTLIVCACAVGLRSARLAAALIFAGWPHVANLRGGMFRWALEGRPLEDACGPTRALHPFDERWGRLLAPLRQEIAA